MVYILVPLIDGSVAKIKAQIVDNTLECQTKNLPQLAEMLQARAKSEGYMDQEEEIQVPQFGSKAVLMLGRSHQHLAPKPVYSTPEGLTLYSGCIDGPGAWKFGSMKGGQRTLCLGGSLLKEEKKKTLSKDIDQEKRDKIQMAIRKYARNDYLVARTEPEIRAKYICPALSYKSSSPTISDRERR